MFIRSFYSKIVMLLTITIAGVALILIADHSGGDLLMTFGSGAFISGVVGLTTAYNDTTRERRLALEEIYLISERFASICKFLRPVDGSTVVDERTIRAYEVLIRDTDRLNILWNRSWFYRRSDGEYFYENLYKPIHDVGGELQSLWRFRLATNAPMEAYHHDILSIQSLIFDPDGNNIAAAKVGEAGDKLLALVNGIRF